MLTFALWESNRWPARFPCPCGERSWKKETSPLG